MRWCIWMAGYLRVMQSLCSWQRLGGSRRCVPSNVWSSATAPALRSAMLDITFTVLENVSKFSKAVATPMTPINLHISLRRAGDISDCKAHTYAAVKSMSPKHPHEVMKLRMFWCTAGGIRDGQEERGAGVQQEQGARAAAAAVAEQPGSTERWGSAAGRAPGTAAGRAADPRHRRPQRRGRRRCSDSPCCSK